MTVTRLIRERAPQTTVVCDGAYRHAVDGDAESVADELNALRVDDPDSYTAWCDRAPVARIVDGIYPDNARFGSRGDRACDLLLQYGAGEVYYDYAVDLWRSTV